MGWWNKLFGANKHDDDFNNTNPSPEEILSRDFIQTTANSPVFMGDSPNPAEETAFYLKMACHDFAGENQSHQSDWFSSSNYSGFKNSDSEF